MTQEIEHPENEQEKEIVETEEEETNSDGLTIEQQLARSQADANKWRRIAQKKEKTPIITNNSDTADELKLIARGLSDEEIDQAKVIAKGKGVALTEAIKDPLFITYQEKMKEDKRKEDAKLGGTRGSGESNGDAPLVTPTMTREEHMKVVKDVLG